MPRRSTWCLTPFSILGGVLILAIFVHGDGTLGGAKWLALHAFLIVFVWFWRPQFAPALVLFGYAALSLLWSPDPGQGAYQLLNAAGLLAVYLAAPNLDVRLIARVGIVGATILGVLDPAFYGGFGNENFLTSFILIAMPLAGFWAVPAAAYLWFNGSILEWGVLLAVGVYYLFIWRWWAGLVASALLGGAVAYGMIYVVPAPLEHVFWSLGSRVEIWANTFRMWLEAPVFGHGFGSFLYEYPRFMEWFPFDHTDGAHVYVGAAHNEYLHLLSELGLVGLVLSIPLLIGVKYKAPLFVAGVLAFVDLPLQNAPTAILVALVLGSALERGHRHIRDEGLSKPPLLWAGGRRPF